MLNEMARSTAKFLRKQGRTYEDIGNLMGCCRETVSKIMKEPIEKKYKRKNYKPSKVYEYREDIERWLKEELPILRMFENLRELPVNPYKGSRSVFYEQVGKIRKELDLSEKNVSVRFEGMPAEYLQIDWGEVRNFPFVQKEGETRYIFAARLKYSRVMYVEFCDNMRLEKLIRCHLRCFEYIGGVPWCCVYDNMKTVITGRDANGAPIWNKTFGKFAAELEFHRQVCDKCAGNQKGTVENLVKYVKSNFLPGREFLDDVDLKNRCNKWLEKVNSKKNQAHNKTPFELLPEEKKKFTPLLTSSQDYGLMFPCNVNQESLINLKGNSYSVPTDYVKKTVIARLKADSICVYDGAEEKPIAKHSRCFDTGKRIMEPDHYEKVFKKKRKAQIMMYRDDLLKQDEQLWNYISNLCHRRRGIDGFGPDILKMYELFKKHGKEDFLAAIALCAEWDAYGSEYLESILEMPNKERRSSLLPIAGLPGQDDIDRPMDYYLDCIERGD